MASNIGYGLLAGIEGFKSGFNMAQQKQEMEWQKKQKKKLEEKELRIQEGAALYNSLVAQVFADGIASEDEMMKLNTVFAAAGYEVQAVIKDSHNNIQLMKKNELEQDFALLDMYADMTEGWKPEDIDGVFNDIKSNVKSEKGINMFDAYYSLQKKQYKVTQKEETMEIAKMIEPGARAPFLEQELGIDIPEAEVTPEAPSASERKYNWAIEHYNLPEEDPDKISFEELKKFFGVSITPEKSTGLKKQIQDIKTQGLAAGISQEEINTAVKNKILGKPTPEPVTTPTTFKNLQDIKDSFKNVKTRTEYDQALASYNASKEAKASDWTPPPFEGQLTDLIKKVEEAFWADFVNKSGKLKDKGESELYNKRVQQYLALIEEARNAGVDVSQFQAFIPYKELYWGRGNPLVTKESW